MNTPTHPDTVLIVDFGSQVTQLIARRVREAGVYCEIVPFQSADEAFQRLKPKAVILSGSPALHCRYRQSARAAGSLRQPACRFFGICYGEQTMCAQLGGKVESRASPRIRPRLSRHRGRMRAVRWRLGQGHTPSGVDEPWRPRYGDARWLQGRRHLHRTRPLRRSPTRAQNTTPCSSTRKSCTRRMAPSCSKTSSTHRRHQGRLVDVGLSREGGRSHPQAGRRQARSSALCLAASTVPLRPC